MSNKQKRAGAVVFSSLVLCQKEKHRPVGALEHFVSACDLPEAKTGNGFPFLPLLAFLLLPCPGLFPSLTTALGSFSPIGTAAFLHAQIQPQTGHYFILHVVRHMFFPFSSARKTGRRGLGGEDRDRKEVVSHLWLVLFCSVWCIGLSQCSSLS